MQQGVGGVVACWVSQPTAQVMLSKTNRLRGTQKQKKSYTLHMYLNDSAAHNAEPETVHSVACK